MRIDWSKMRIVPITLKAANQFVSQYHRHHKPSVGHKFSIGLNEADLLIGVAIMGRPVARGSDNGFTIEVSRLCTNGQKNACSMLYQAAARASKELGYKKIQTYTLQTESGISLKGAGWKMEAITAGGKWNHTHGDRNNTHPTEPKQRWVRDL
jgi:hypothetical protein